MDLECYIMQTYTVICISVYIKSHTGNTMKLKENWKKRENKCQSISDIKENKSTYPRHDFFGHVV